MKINRRIKKWIKLLIRTGIPRVQPRIIREFKHDPQAFTQGLAFRDGRIYESTGRQGQSYVRCLDLHDGKELLVRHVKDGYVWTEGIAVLDARLVQLTWKNRKALVYTFPELLQYGEMNYKGEGWGLTSGDGFFIMTDGTDRLIFRDRDFSITRTVRVTMNGLPIKRLNDLEFVDGIVYANVWYSNEILAISAGDGKVQAIIDCQNLVDIEQPQDPESVLNGIAFNPQRETFIITGKCWSRFFEVSFQLFHESAANYRGLGMNGSMTGEDR